MPDFVDSPKEAFGCGWGEERRIEGQEKGREGKLRLVCKIKTKLN